MVSRNAQILVLTLSMVILAGCHSADSPEPQTPKYDPATATARVFGSVKFEGTPPEPMPIRAGGSAYCVRNGHGIVDETVSLTEDNKLRNVVVFVRSGQEGRQYSAPSEAADLDQQKCVYIPHVVTVMTNQKLRVKNSDPTFHNVHGMSQSNPSFNFAQSDKGTENVLTFSHPEMPFRVGCDLHRWMGALVAVFDHPFHTTTGTSGTYELRLPPGKYEIAAWHEKYGEKRMSIELSGNDTTELSFTFSEHDHS